MSIGHWLTEDDLKHPDNLIEIFKSLDEKVGTLIKFKIYKLDDGNRYSVHLNTIREDPTPDERGFITVITGDNAVAIFDNFDEREKYSRELIEAIKKTGTEIEIRDSF